MKPEQRVTNVGISNTCAEPCPMKPGNSPTIEEGCGDDLIQRWVMRKQATAVCPEIDEFINDVLHVCRKHGLSIEHEDMNGGFLVTAYNDDAARWLLDAADAT